jgi:hypothetical protein
MTTKTFKILVNNDYCPLDWTVKQYYAHLQIDIKEREGSKLEVYVSSPSISLARISIKWRVLDWYNVTAQELVDDIELSTKRSEYVCFGTMYQEVWKLKIRDHFGIESDYSPEERAQLFKLWYSNEARKLTNASQFPLRRRDISRQYPNGWEIYTCPTTGKKKKVDQIASCDTNRKGA